TVPNEFYAATDGAGIFKTIDGGTNWTAINGSGATALGCLEVRSISLVTIAPNRTLLISTSCRNGSGVYRSTDDGATWTRVGPAPGLAGSIPGDVQSSALNRSGTTLYLLATFNYGIFKSTDDGATWAPANTGFTGTNAFNVTFSGTAELLTYIHGDGLYRSTDTAATWVRSDTGLPAGYAALGGINRETGPIQYIGLDKQGIYRTTNGGLSWAPWGNTANDGDARYSRGISSPVAAIPGLYYLSTIEGVLKTTDSGATLQAAGNVDGGRVNAITHDRDTPSAAYLASKIPIKINNIYGDYSSPTNASALENGITGATNDGVVYQDKLSPSTLYVTTNNRGVFKSTNGGTSFNAINNGLPNMIGQGSRLAIDPTNSQNLYLGLPDEAGVYKSTNGGASWVASSSGLTTPRALSINNIVGDPNNPAIYWLATLAGAYKTTNSGATWTQMYSAVDVAASALSTAIVRVRPGNSNEVYLANRHVNANGAILASSGILKSTDGGTSWNNILPSQPASQVRVTAGGDIYAGISAPIGSPAVYLSTNGGTSFAPYSTGLQGSDIRSFGFAADDTAVISASLENGFYTNNAAQPAPPLLTVNKQGSGSITSAPTGINCGATCSATFTFGSTVTLTAATLSGSTFAGWTGGGCSGTGTCVVTMTAATTVTATFTGGPFSLLAVQSRKTHTGIGAFDIPIDTAVAIGGLVTVEPRTIGLGHTIVFQFSGPVTSVGGVTSLDAASAPIGSATTAIAGNDVVVTLTGVPENRRANITLSGVNTSTSATVAMGFMVGDVNNTRSVNSSDISGVKARSGQTTTALNFKFDVNSSGAINSSDISAVKARSGQVLP
ncbi:MAG: dockerin type I domain-containing protein, partial [Usitatibacteraceae bacterium]